MNTKNFSTLILLIFSSLCFGQMPIGKDIKVGTNEVKLFFKKKGLHLIKQENKTQKFQYREDNYTFLSYKEEMGILLYKNEYNNIKEISYYTDDLQTYNKLLKYLKNENWNFLSRNRLGDETYEYNGYKIELLSFSDDENHKEIRIKK